MPSVKGLAEICIDSVVELKFVRRNKARLPRERRMLCTLDSALLNSALGKKTLKFRSPRFPPLYNAASKGLLVVWDIIMQDWRAVPTRGCEVVARIKTSPKLEKNFWEYYDKVLKKMTSAQKRNFMDR